ncbi:hypothetical protein ILUMI_00214 [Ignelater luminosus]|uniref:Uncharacterized protein n=1 Tax=Ignelater luminosus TaxID=2038154 RepID=A0A8K0DHQ3_IGNLU|nr:hypothetical protein ILUMI_00214 [Ignelater luminosus]
MNMTLFIVSYELAWRKGEGARCLTDYFSEELQNDGTTIGRLLYNLVFSKRCQKGASERTADKWLISNLNSPKKCPVQLSKKIMPKDDRKISKWIEEGAQTVGSIDTKTRKITNRSLRSTAASHLSKAGVGEQELIKITEHGNSSSIQPYLLMDVGHHEQIIEKF